MDVNNSSRESTNSDYFILIGGFVILLIAGVASIHWFPQAILTSFACGIIAAIITYRFLGGFSKEDTFQATGIKFGGAIGALLAVTTIINISLSQQIEKWSQDWQLDPKPAGYEKFLVIDGDGNIQKLVVKVRNRDNMQVSISPNKEQLNKFVEACLSKPGVCIPEPKPVIIKVMNELDRGKAKVCENRLNYTGLPISLSKGNDNYISVRIQYDKENCNDHDAALKLKISCVDYKELTKVPTTEAITYQLGPFRTPTDAPLKSRKITCSA